MVETERYDIVIFGGGKAGKTLAMDQAKAGKTVALVEAGMIGGACINIACIPTKTLVRSAQVADIVRHSEPFGTTATVTKLDMPRIAARTASVVTELVDLHLRLFRESGLNLILGWGRFIAPRVIEVETASGIRRVTGERIYLDLGTTAAIPPVPGLAAAAPLTHVEALKLETLPDRLLILGGGYIGMEMAQAFRRLGSEVVVLEAGPQLAAREDKDVAAAIEQLFKDDGIELAHNARDLTVSGRSGGKVSVRFGDGRRFSGTHLLVAAGRTPSTHGIGLDIAGVTLNDRGFISVDERLLTTAPNIWAMGEAAGTPMFTHASLDDYRVAKSGITGGDRTTSGRLIPSCVFIDPEFSRIGLNEREAQQAGLSYRLAKIPMTAVPRALTLSERTGFMKALVGTEDDRILGFMMLGAHAGEVLAAVQMAMLGNLPFTALRDGIIAHPTLAEGLNVLFSDVRKPGP